MEIRIQDVVSFMRDDFNKSLFPLNTNMIVAEIAGDDIRKYISEKILDQSAAEHNFLPQSRVYAAKPNWHIRRTVKLDPVAEFFIYDLILRNRKSFKQPSFKNRLVAGYSFYQGVHAQPSQSYSEFREKLSECMKKYKNYIHFDIASYFNSIYHHDLAAWFSTRCDVQKDIEALDQFLRQINSGRSIDCLPQGIYPCKVIGQHFLDFIDKNIQLTSSYIIRFMDDFYLFDNDMSALLKDFDIIQKLLGDKGLSVNPQKTIIGKTADQSIKKKIDIIKLSLLRIRRDVINVSGREVAIEKEEETKLSRKQIEYLLDLLKAENLQEEDAELALSLLKEHSEKLVDHIPSLMERFPNLAKNIYFYCHNIGDRTAVVQAIENLLDKGTVTDYQLFWYAKLCADQLLNSAKGQQAIIRIYNHPEASPITKAKILETPDDRFGLSEIRFEHLKSGRSDWLSWASAVGARTMKPNGRNHALDYFANAGAINRIIASAVRRYRGPTDFDEEIEF